MKVLKPILFVCLTLGLAAACQPPASIPGPAAVSPPEAAADAIHGRVLDAEGRPLAGATVRIQATENATQTGADGSFTLRGLEAGLPVTVSAWKQDYYCASAEKVSPPAEGVVLTLRTVQTGDNPAYEWMAPSGENSCYACKPGVTQIWLDNDAHGRSAQNIRFLSMYNGTDVDGNQSPPTRYGTSRDYGSFPLRPDLSQPYYGPGYKLDFPESAGNCAACHAPGAAVDAPYGVDPNTVEGADVFGIHCDYCHKVADVRLDPASGLPFPNMPGVLSQDIRRPFPEDPDRYQIFFGTFDDDNVPLEDTNLPLIRESRWCAPCHYGVFWDTVIYNSYGEWLASPYSDPQTGRTCQQCHMPAPSLLDGQALTNVAPGKGGVERDPLSIHAHTFPGASSTALLQNAVTLEASARREGEQVVVEVTLTNDQTGHHVPSDSPLRQMLLLVQVTGPGDAPLRQVDGPVVPEWGGVGDPAQGYYAGLPGKGYAKILMELWTELSPSASYWNPTRILSDNRLAAFASDESSYTFAAPAEGAVSVQVDLLYRRAFKQLMDQKGWDDADILMKRRAILLEER